MAGTDMKNRILLNPPPRNERCERCGKHISELPKFNDDSILAKTFRRMASDNPYDVSNCLNEDDSLNEGKFIEKYSSEDLEEYWFIEQLILTVEPSWECVYCIVQER